MTAYRVTLLVKPQTFETYSDDTPDNWDWPRLLDIPPDAVKIEAMEEVPDWNVTTQRQRKARATAETKQQEELIIDCE